MRNPQDDLSGALRIAALYALFAGLWILFSDMAVEFFFASAASRAAAQTYKGWFFVLVTAVLLFVLVRRQLSSSLEAQRALFETRDKFHSAFADLPLPAHGHDARGTIIFWNRACEQEYGFTAEEMLGQNRMRLYLQPPDNTNLPPERSSRSKMTVIARDGTTIPVFSSRLRLTLPDGAVETLMLDIPLNGSRDGAAGIGL